MADEARGAGLARPCHHRRPQLGIVGLFDANVVEEILGPGTAADVVYVIAGLAGLAMVPRLFEEPRLGPHRAHATGV